VCLLPSIKLFDFDKLTPILSNLARKKQVNEQQEKKIKRLYLDVVIFGS
jgi:hypothetical protein